MDSKETIHGQAESILRLNALFRYGSFHYLVNAGCAGKTVRSLENVCHIWAT